MNDDFLTRHQKSPRHEFVAALYERINIPMKTQSNISFRRLTFAAALCVALIAAFAFSPAAKAALSAFIREIGGITYLGPEEVSSQAPANADAEQTVRGETLSLAEARDKLPFTFSLPTWVPDGYVMSPSVQILYFSDENTPVTIQWLKSEPNSGPLPLFLHVSQLVNWIVDLDQLQEVQINGEPAGLTGGGWDADSGQWDTQNRVLTLTWTRGEVMYQLHSNGATVEELIKVAESIP